MDTFKRIIEINLRLDQCRIFSIFVDQIHRITKCNDPSCKIKFFLEVLKTNVFDEELSYDTRRLFSPTFVRTNLEFLSLCIGLDKKGTKISKDYLNLLMR